MIYGQRCHPWPKLKGIQTRSSTAEIEEVETTKELASKKKLVKIFEDHEDRFGRDDGEVQNTAFTEKKHIVGFCWVFSRYSLEPPGVLSMNLLSFLGLQLQ